MAVTLADLAKQEREPLRKGIMTNLLRFSDILAVVPFESVDSLDNIVVRWKELPDVAFRNINEGYGEETGTTEQITETVYGFGGDIKIDRVFEYVKNVIEPPEVTQTKMKTKAMAFKFNDMYINGSHIVDPKSFEGLKVRVAKLPSRQTIDLASSGDALKVFATAGTTDHAFLDGLHQLVAYVDGGATHLFMNLDTRLKIAALLRRMGIGGEALEIWEKKVDTFQAVPMIDVGLKPDKSTEIILSTEDPGDGGDDSTSIYAVRFAVGESLCGINLNELDVYDPLKGGEMEGGPQMLRRIDWWCGLANWSDYSIARLKGFKMAAS